MTCLYVMEHGASIGMHNNRMEIKTRDGELKSLPIELLESVEIHGKSQITTQAVEECLERGIPVSFYSHGGYCGRLVPLGAVSVSRQRMQFEMTKNKEFCLAFSRRIIAAKIHNQKVILRRYAREKDVNVNEEIAVLGRLEKRTDRCLDTAEIMGCEGFAARMYFQGLGKLVEKEFFFEKRSKRPPKDEFNALLSLGYSMLFHELYSKIEGKGLNAYLGVLHQDREKHPALVSDLMEEWRTVIVDAVVMSLVNGHEIKKEDFIRNVNGIYLNEDGRRIFIGKMERKMSCLQKYLEYTENAVTFRRALDLQVAGFIQCMEKEDAAEYHPVRIR